MAFYCGGEWTCFRRHLISLSFTCLWLFVFVLCKCVSVKVCKCISVCVWVMLFKKLCRGDCALLSPFHRVSSFYLLTALNVLTCLYLIWCFFLSFHVCLGRILYEYNWCFFWLWICHCNCFRLSATFAVLSINEAASLWLQSCFSFFFCFHRSL